MPTSDSCAILSISDLVRFCRRDPCLSNGENSGFIALFNLELFTVEILLFFQIYALSQFPKPLHCNMQKSESCATLSISGLLRFCRGDFGLSNGENSGFIALFNLEIFALKFPLFSHFSLMRPFSETIALQLQCNLRVPSKFEKCICENKNWFGRVVQHMR